MKRVELRLMIVLLIAVLSGCAGSQAYQRGERYAQRGEWDLAVKEYREANRRSPRDIEYRSAVLRAEETAATQHYNKARNFLNERKLDQAITELQQALYLNPGNAAVQSALKSVLNMKQAEEHYRAALTFMDLGRVDESVSELNHAVELDPENVKYLDSLEKVKKKRAEAEPDEALTLASDKLITLNFKNTNVKDVFEFLSKLSGINILFDEEVRSQPVTIFVKDVSFQYAMNLLLSTNKLFMKKVSADTIIIVPKSKAKLDQYQDLMVKTFYINISKAKDLVNLLRSMLEIKKVYVNEALNSITVRETPEKMKLVEKVIAANDLKEGEVVLDVEILEISRSNSIKYGWNFTPSGLSASASINSAADTTSSISLTDLKNTSSDNIFVTLPGIVVDLIKQDSDAQTLANPRLRVLNNKKAKFLIGEKIPVQTSTIQSTTVGQVTSNLEYKEVGIKLTIEPTIHLNNTVTIKLEMEVSNLGEAISFGSGQQAYKFGTRSTETYINLRDGETVIIGGLIKDEERKSRLKIPILGDIPILGKLFTHADDGTIKTDILMSITPNIVRNMELADMDSQVFWSGTEEAYDTKPLFTTSGKSSKQPERAVDKAATKWAEAAPPASGDMARPLSAPTTTGLPPTVLPAVLAIKPSDVSLSVGQEARLDLNAGNMRDLYGAIVTLSYDPKVVEFKIANEGTLLKKDNQQTSFLFSNNIKAGTVDIYMTRIGDVGGVEGTGSLCTLVFQAKSGGMSELSMKSVKLTNYNREQIRMELKGAKLNVK